MPVMAVLAEMREQLQKQGEQLQKQGEQLGKVDARLGSLEARLGSLEARGQSKTSPLATGSKTPPLSASGGGGGGGGGGGVSLTDKSSGSSSGASSPKCARLRAAFAASSAIELPVVPGSSRDMPMDLQQRLMAHRMRTDLRLDECDYFPLSLVQSMVRPTITKGFSLFVVASEDATVVAAAHAARSAITKKHAGCVAWCLASLPPRLVLTLDRALDSTAEGTPIVWHATLSPREEMTYTEFVATFEGWGGAAVCELQGAGAAREGEGEAEPTREHLSTFCESSAPYAMAKLDAHAAALAQNAGGSPGTV